MKKKSEKNTDVDSMEELKIFHAKKKKEQEALKKLLEALDKKLPNRN